MTIISDRSEENPFPHGESIPALHSELISGLVDETEYAHQSMIIVSAQYYCQEHNNVQINVLPITDVEEITIDTRIGGITLPEVESVNNMLLLTTSEDESSSGRRRFTTKPSTSISEHIGGKTFCEVSTILVKCDIPLLFPDTPALCITEENLFTLIRTAILEAVQRLSLPSEGQKVTEQDILDYVFFDEEVTEGLRILCERFINNAKGSKKGMKVSYK